jgi:hypothetical protein
MAISAAGEIPIPLGTSESVRRIRTVCSPPGSESRCGRRDDGRRRGNAPARGPYRTGIPVHSVGRRELARIQQVHAERDRPFGGLGFGGPALGQGNPTSTLERSRGFLTASTRPAPGGRFRSALSPIPSSRSRGKREREVTKVDIWREPMSGEAVQSNGLAAQSNSESFSYWVALGTRIRNSSYLATMFSITQRLFEL